MRQLFLPVGLILAVLTALLLPGPGVFLASHHANRILICIIFVVSGYQTGTKGIRLDHHLFRTLATAATISLLLSPLLGLGLGTLLPLSPSLFLGLMIISSVPPTLSSGIVLTEISRGNTVLALLLTISLNLLGIFTLPLVLGLSLGNNGPMSIDQGALLIKMLLLVLLPFGLGRGIRSALGKQRVSPHWSYVNSSCIILAVYASLSAAREAFFTTGPSEYALIIASVVLIHFLLLGINAWAASLLRLPQGDRNALVLVASQKTLPVSLAVFAGIEYDTSNAVIVCLLFHFIQLIADSFLAPLLGRQVIRSGPDSKEVP